MYVFDATPLITLASIDRLDLLEGLVGGSLVPERVVSEVVDEGIEAGYPDARRIKHAIDDGMLEPRDVPDSPRFSDLRAAPNLSDADAAVLALAADVSGVAVMDEQAGRAIADTEGIDTRGTAYLVLLSVREGRIDADTGREIIDEMLEAGWHCSPGLYARLVSKLDSFESE